MESSKNLKENDFKCEICEKSFHTNLKRNQHIKNAHGEVKNFTCNVCNKIFGGKYNLNYHLNNYHQNGSKKFKCDSCGKSFTLLRSLKKHKTVVHDLKKNMHVILAENPSNMQNI